MQDNRSPFDTILRVHNGDKAAAALEVARSLMAHDPSDPFRQGYTMANAVLAVVHLYDLNAVERESVVVALGGPAA